MIYQLVVAFVDTMIPLLQNLNQTGWQCQDLQGDS